jgi:hypothetical protein
MAAVVTEDKTPEDPQLLEVRATVNLAGLRAGETALVDPAQPYIADCLKSGYLVALPKDGQA